MKEGAVIPLGPLMEVHKMKLNKQAVNLAVMLLLLTVAADSWAHGLNSVTIPVTALIILGGLVQMLAVKSAVLQPQPVLVEAAESGKQGK
jgi:predicted phage tail protein